MGEEAATTDARADAMAAVAADTGEDEDILEKDPEAKRLAEKTDF